MRAGDVTARDFADVGQDMGDGAIVAAIDTARKARGDRLVTATPYAWRDPSALPQRQWIYGRSIQRGHLRAIVAQGGAGKTILSVAEALAMVTGRDFLGQPIPGGPKRVWLWNLEDDGDELARIVQAACKHWCITEADIGGRLFIDSALEGAVLKLARSSASDGLVINRPLVDDLVEEMRSRRIDYLHVDPFVSSHAANESDNMEIDAIAKEWALVAKRADAGVGLAHHVSKAGAAEATALSARGAVALINACRSVITLNRMGEDEGKRYGIEDEKRRRYFRTYDDKNNRAPPSDKSDWFQMLSVDLGNGDENGPGYGDSMGVVVPWSPPDAFEGVTSDHLHRVQKAIDGGMWKESAQAGDWVGQVVADIMGLSAEKEAKTDRARINAILRTWIANGALVVVEKRCPKKREDKKFVEVGEWAVVGSAPPATSGAGQGGASRAPIAPRPTPPPYGGGGGGAGAADKYQVGRGSQYPHDNPALSPLSRVVFGEDGRIKRKPILAPGEDPEDMAGTF